MILSFSGIYAVVHVRSRSQSAMLIIGLYEPVQVPQWRLGLGKVHGSHAP